ncbi:hypothetical protein [Streptomyces europaeiscabiei]|uniref:hypothetical protein n=1 Tax=Streptomyces europaeiscabiei TaxID=146819 RepID=UPI0029B122F8|nr:hypothetical protein [Streptomyces europaeiscabiei]MDX2528245.1 hypothetical protein [Streptomyces europaeiscabiei]MDX3711024.1 hypothetical protein [Streptomyces europaeiscabiei]
MGGPTAGRVVVRPGIGRAASVVERRSRRAHLSASLTANRRVCMREYLARYVRPTGRDLPVSEIERFVCGEKV